MANEMRLNVEGRNLSDSVRNRISRYAVQGLVAINMAGLTMIGIEDSVREMAEDLPAVVGFVGEGAGIGLSLAKPFLSGIVGMALTYISTVGAGRYVRDYQDEGGEYV